jgi:hypothetical protein
MAKSSLSQAIFIEALNDKTPDPSLDPGFSLLRLLPAGCFS